MGYSNQFFGTFGIDNSRGAVRELSKRTCIPASRLMHYNNTNTLPTGKDLERLVSSTGVSELALMLRMGHLDRKALRALSANAEELAKLIEQSAEVEKKGGANHRLSFETELGKLYEGDCLSVLEDIDSDSIDMVFADPPFNLSKIYPSNIDDNLKEESYLEWCEEWIGECIRVLKHGGALFLWNLPVWNSKLTSFVESKMNFKHWIAVDIKYSLPVPGRLYPSHYSLLYYIKGEKPSVFHPDRLPMLTCPKCFGDLKDYGGYKDKMNPLGVNMTDIWYDIPPVRHAKYKKRKDANELSVKLLDRVIELASNEGDTILDPFGGSGTTYVVSELKGRRWVGAEIGPVDIIVDRFKSIEQERTYLESLRSSLNSLFPEKVKEQRDRLGLWTCESVRKPKEELQTKMKF